MAKLTEAQKALNKEASILRQSAYHARTKAYHEAESKAEAEVLLTPENRLAEEAETATNEAIEARNLAAKEIESQISALNQKLIEVRAHHNTIVDALNEGRKAAWNKKRELLDSMKEVINKEFPDIAVSGCWGSGTWIPPDGYIEKFAAENADNIAKKKALREKKQAKKNADR